MGYRSKMCRCCGGATTVQAVDNHGQPYTGCASCVIASETTARRTINAKRGREETLASVLRELVAQASLADEYIDSEPIHNDGLCPLKGLRAALRSANDVLRAMGLE